MLPDSRNGSIHFIYKIFFILSENNLTSSRYSPSHVHTGSTKYPEQTELISNGGLSTGLFAELSLDIASACNDVRRFPVVASTARCMSGCIMDAIVLAFALFASAPVSYVGSCTNRSSTSSLGPPFSSFNLTLTASMFVGSTEILGFASDLSEFLRETWLGVLGPT